MTYLLSAVATLGGQSFQRRQQRCGCRNVDNLYQNKKVVFW